MALAGLTEQLLAGWPPMLPVPTPAEIEDAFQVLDWAELDIPIPVRVSDAEMGQFVEVVCVRRRQQLSGQLTEPVPEVHQPAAPDRLSPALAFDMGRRSVQLEQSQSLDEHLGEQKQVYLDTLRTNPKALVQALLDRDRVIAQIGRDLYTGKGGTALLREFVRAQLYAADKGSPEAIQRMLEGAFGKDMKADARQIRERGHMLGPTPEQKMDPLQDAIDHAPTAPKGTVGEEEPRG